MENIKSYMLFLLLTGLTFSTVVRADAIQLKNEAFKEVEVVKDGKKEYQLISPATVVPKDEIIYITTFKNVGDKPATDIVITNPLPNNSLYKNGSAFGAGTEITFSIDGGKNYAEPAELKVRNKQGELVEAKSTDYTHIRWVYNNSLAAGAEGTVTFRTIIK